ncbi:hypothetical protein V6Z11_D11G141800 [Gossypium hirsutum]
MHHQSIAFKPLQFPFPPRLHPPNAIPSRRLFPLHLNTTAYSPCSASSCQSFHIPLPTHPPRSLPSSNSTKNAALKTVDVATLGNLCVDIVLNVPKLPPSSKGARKAIMEQLSSSPPDKQYWEAGGNCNVAIAAARLGLNCITIGYVGNEIYGKFLLDVLRDEGIRMVGMNEEADVVNSPSASHQTLLCWVLVDPLQKHGFCSPADFFEEPAFSWMSTLSEEVKRGIKRSRILFCNGPRGKSLLRGTMEEQKALRHFLRMSDVLLLTSDEAESLTGIANPILAGQELLRTGVRTKWVVVKMGPRGSILITTSNITCASAFKVKVMDTVGCGDSFVAAIAFGFIHNIPLVTTLAFANAVGAATAMGCGAGRNVAALKQVVELMEAPNLNEDDEFWNELLGEHLDSQEVTFLSKMILNGSNGRMNRVTFQKAVSELLPKLKSSQLEGTLSC